MSRKKVGFAEIHVCTNPNYGHQYHKFTLKTKPRIDMKIVAYLKPTCGWSQGVRAIFKKYNLEYEDLNIIDDRSLYAQMVAKSGQHLSPCVEIDGIMLADVSGEEVENYLLGNKLVSPNAHVPEVPTNQACASHRAEDPQTVRFF